MHAKTDSEATSLAPSSPDHNRRQVYYVQSPSRDSQDGEKTTTSFHSTPVLGSPTGSPPQSSFGRHSRKSSTSRFSGSLKPGSKKISPNDVGSGGRGRKNFKPQKPKIAVKSITFERFVVQAGSDDTGISTDMISVNATAKLTFRNTATFFGVHVRSTPLALSYSQLTIGSGDMKKFYQSRKSQRNVVVSVIGDKIPMYGSGASLSTSTGMTNLPVPLKLDFTVRSRAYALGKLVNPKFNMKIECSIVFDPKKLNVPMH